MFGLGNYFDSRYPALRFVAITAERRRCSDGSRAMTATRML